MTPQQDQDCSSPENVGDRQLVATFVHVAENGSHRAHSGGNPCVLVMRGKAPEESLQPSTGLTVCYSWPSRSGASPVINVICYTPDDRAIQCCGHGLLAAAYCWLQRLQLNEVSLLMNGSQVPGWRVGQTTWLSFKRLPTMKSPVPSWVREVFANQPQPEAAAVCGDEQGYLVLQWPDDFDLVQLAQPQAALSGETQRALICTSAQPASGAEAIQLRYFAPQYGVLEDAATGSALRVLAEYWSGRFTELTAEQCSSVGGTLLAKWSSTHIEVGGHCEYVELESEYA